MKLSEIHIRDPFILTFEGKYYLFGTPGKFAWQGSGGFWCNISEDLENWSEPIKCFDPPEGFWATENYWAPEVHYYNNRFYMFASFMAKRHMRAVPFNRRWPGHQRGIEQTELINFLSCAAEEPLEFEITPKNPFEEINVRPKSLGIVTKKTDNGTIVFTLESPSYFTVEPFGRNNALHIFVDPIVNYNIRLVATDLFELK